MEKISKDIQLAISAKDAFEKFVRNLNDWWPREYTWSQEKLREIRIDGLVNGFCSEIGPYGFRCDWGRVIAYSPDNHISFTWQISPRREPIPDPDKSSLVNIKFTGDDPHTLVSLEHDHLERHGDGAQEYKEMMDSPQGWEYILDCYRKYCEQ